MSPQRPPFRHVACCIDDVAGAGATIAEARRLAVEPPRVSVLHVAPPEPVVRSGLSEWGEAAPDDPLAAPRAWLAETVAAAGGGEPVLLSGDPPADEACRWAGDHGVDLLVATARAGGLRHRVLGSFAGRLAASAPCHVLLLAGAADPGSLPAEPTGPYREVACVSDGSQASLRAVDAAAVLRAPEGGRVRVLTVRSRWRRLLAALGANGSQAPESVLEERVRRLGAQTPVRLGGRPGPAVEDWVREQGADLVVVPGEAPLGPALRRSAGRLVAEGLCTVLIARPGAIDGA